MANFFKKYDLTFRKDGVIDVWKGVKTAKIPNGVKKINSSAFSGCKKLESVILPGSMRSIEKGAFKGIATLKSVTLNRELSEIGENAFHGTSIREITIPYGVKKIGYGALEVNQAITIHFKGSKEEWEKLTAPTSEFYNKMFNPSLYTGKEHKHHPMLDSFPTQPCISPYLDDSLITDEFISYILKMESALLENAVEKAIEEETKKRPFVIYGPVDKVKIREEVIHSRLNTMRREYSHTVRSFKLPEGSTVDYDYKGE